MYMYVYVYINVYVCVYVCMCAPCVRVSARAIYSHQYMYISSHHCWTILLFIMDHDHSGMHSLIKIYINYVISLL